MTTGKGKIDRRSLLKTGLAAAAGTALGPINAGGVLAAMPKSKAGIPVRSFGNTGVDLPILGMGGSAMVNVWAPSYGVKLDSEDKRAEMVRYAFDQGIRYFDTARVYSESESILGRGLEGVRDQAFVASKIAVMKPEHVRPSVEKSLEELRTDYVDLMQIHSPAIEAIGARKAMKLYEELLKLRDEKMLRFIGLTTHVAFEDVFKMLDTGGFDQVMLAYGYFPKGMDTLLSNRNLEFRNRCLARAHELGMAIVSMKVMGAFIMGHNAKNLVRGYHPDRLASLPGAAIRWVLQDDRIAMLNIGVSMPSDIDKNKRILASALDFTDDDRELLADYAVKAMESDIVKSMKTV
ncbi:MAG: aldo/keto reductase [Pseudomonadales bacterium]|nr:aldo/keto reductase [Pseudomonadales bacterium]